MEERVAIALELIKRERSLDEIREHYRVSHTTAYKLRNLFLEGGRRALMGASGSTGVGLEARVRALEEKIQQESPRLLGSGGRRGRTARR